MEVGKNEETGKYVKKQTRSVPEGWGKKIVGRRVDFKDSEKGLAWGIEVELPFGDKNRKTLEKAGIIIPKRINKIRYLDMAPQENLPEKERNIGSESNQELVLSHLNTLVGVTATPGYPGPTLLFRNRVEKRLRHLFEGVITRKKRNKELFNSKIAESKGNEILMVYGHGGGDPMQIGEQDDDKTVDESGKVLQRKGNTVPVDEIVSRYNQPDTFSAIMFYSCYIGEKGIVKKDVPVFYGKGILSIANIALGKRKFAVAKEESQ